MGGRPTAYTSTISKAPTQFQPKTAQEQLQMLQT